MIITFVFAVLIIVLDQVFKHIVVDNLRGGETLEILGGLVKFQYVENRGMAFGMLQNLRWVFIIFTVVLLVAIILYIVKVKPSNKLLLTSLSLIIGGGVGNLIDRIVSGYVVDYIQLSFFSPVCNFADYCITIGTALLIVYIIFFTQNENKIKE